MLKTRAEHDRCWLPSKINTRNSFTSQSYWLRPSNRHPKLNTTTSTLIRAIDYGQQTDIHRYIRQDLSSFMISSSTAWYFWVFDFFGGVIKVSLSAIHTIYIRINWFPRFMKIIIYINLQLFFFLCSNQGFSSREKGKIESLLCHLWNKNYTFSWLLFCFYTIY